MPGAANAFAASASVKSLSDDGILNPRRNHHPELCQLLEANYLAEDILKLVNAT